MSSEDARRIDGASVLTIAGLAGIGLIHLLDSVETFHETRWLFWAYMALMAASVLVAGALLHHPAPRWFGAAAALALATMVGYVLSRTTGLPGSDDDIGNWTDGLGLASLWVEGAVALAGGYGLAMHAAPRTAPVPRAPLRVSPLER
jgi:hypothetical protein